MLRILLISVIMGLMLISGCTSPPVPNTLGMVEHNNSLTEAYEKCNLLVEKWCYENRWECRKCDKIPSITDCTESECICKSCNL